MPDKSAREIFQKKLNLAKKSSAPKMSESESLEKHELYPKEMIAALEEDIKILGERLSAPDSVEKELLISAAELKKSLDELNKIFGIVSEEVKKEDPNLTLKSIGKKLDLVLDQNRKIAQAILVVSDKLNRIAPSREPLVQKVPAAPRATPISAPAPPTTPVSSSPARPPPPPYDEKKRYIGSAFG